MESIREEQRGAHFYCVIALADPATGATFLSEGRCEGHIAHQDDEDGEYGFGYDAVFIPNGFDKPWSRVSKAEKNRISHRGIAARNMIPTLRKLALEDDR